VLSWESVVSAGLHLFRLDRIRAKILAFALLATLLPSLTLGWQSYRLSQQLITDKISEELRNATSQAVRELTLWVKEHSYEMRVFASSYEVTENLEIVAREPGGQGRASEAQRRLTDYLKSVRSRFSDYEELMVVVPSGRILSSSADPAGAPQLPPDWLKRVQADAVIVGEPRWDEPRGRVVMLIAVSVKTSNDRFLGVLAGTLNFGTLERVLKGSSFGQVGQVHLIRRDGTLIVSSRVTGSALVQTRTAATTARVLFESGEAPVEYADYRGTAVIGSLKPMFQLGWGAVAEISRQEAYAQAARTRRLTLWLVGGLLLGIGLTAYLLGLTIVRPLDRLTAGASRVAAGDLELHLPTVGHGELEHMTQVFNHMVTSLRQGREELAATNVALSAKNEALQELSVTDGLTGLYNRKHLMRCVATEILRARRLNHRFAVLMIDIDHFKGYNDTFGHLAGDRLLTRIAALFRDSVRSIDFAARYGGEEFLLMLCEVGSDGALQVANRIRIRVAQEAFGTEQEPVRVTVSIGVAVFPEHGQAADAIVASADVALYRAKGSGRNQVVVAADDPEKPGSVGSLPYRSPTRL